MENLNTNPNANPPSAEGKNNNKVRLLEQTVENDRPVPINFIGKRYYDEKYIQEANKELSEKLSKEGGTDDESAHLAEWEFTYALGHEEAIPGCHAFLASEYDDHINGIDIVCKITDDNGDKHIFGIDVSTATLPEKVIQKFERGDHPRGQVPSRCAFIKFYQDNNYVACLKGVPRFVLGMSPLFSGHQKYLDNFQINEEGLVSHTPDPQLKFNILSSLFLQSAAIKANLTKNPDGEETTRQRAIDTCTAVREATFNELMQLMEVKDKKDFFKTLNKKITEVRNSKVNGYTDECFNSVINESICRYNDSLKKV